MVMSIAGLGAMKKCADERPILGCGAVQEHIDLTLLGCYLEWLSMVFVSDSSMV